MTALYIVKAKKAFLKSPLSTTASTVILDELIDSQGNDIAMASFGEFGVIVLTQATTVEMIKFTNLSRAVDGTVTLTVATNGRDIAPVTPYAGSSTGQRFNATADAIITNDPLTMMKFGLLNNANVWDLLQSFTIVPETTGGNATTANQLIRKAQLDSAVLGIITAVSIVVDGTAGETLADGNLIYLKSADNRWWKADADTASTVENVILGIAQGAGTAGNLITSGVMLRGVDDAQTGLTAGAKYYASNSAGGISISAGTTEVTVGIAKSTTELYFEPYFDQRLTEDQQDALTGTSGLPSITNKFVTDADTTGTGSVLRSSAVASILQATFGDGSDGNVTIASGTTTISKDMYYNNLTIETGGILNPSGYRVFVKETLTFQGTGKIARNGNDGASATTTTGGAGGSALASGTLSGSVAGGNGANGSNGTIGDASNPSAGGTPSTPSNITNAVGSTAGTPTGAGGNGGTGYNGVAGNNGGGVGTASTVTNPTIMPRTVNNAISLHTLIDATSAFMKGSAGATGGAGGSGGAGGNSLGNGTGGNGGGGGGAGGTGSIVMVCAYAVVGGYANCIQALGGAGGNGANGTNGVATNGGAGGGGGGGNGGTGGVVAFIYHSYTGTALDTTCVAGGAGGTKGIKGTPAVNGGVGTDGTNGGTGATGKLYSFAI